MDSALSAIKVAIIYEDFTSGARARNFAEHLATELDCSCDLSESLWRSELLECPSVAAAAAEEAADCDYLLISLRGDRVLPFPTRLWIEQQLDRAAPHGVGLILLLDPSQGKWRVLEGTRHYFRCVCAEKGVAFFSQMATSGRDHALMCIRDETKASEFVIAS